MHIINYLGILIIGLAAALLPEASPLYIHSGQRIIHYRFGYRKKTLDEYGRSVLIMALLIAALIALSGCATSGGPFGSLAGSGSANYEYTRTLADGTTCSVKMLSGRDVKGAALSIDQHCALTAKADQTTGVESALAAINASIATIKALAEKVP